MVGTSLTLLVFIGKILSSSAWDPAVSNQEAAEKCARASCTKMAVWALITRCDALAAMMVVLATDGVPVASGLHCHVKSSCVMHCHDMRPDRNTQTDKQSDRHTQTGRGTGIGTDRHMQARQSSKPDRLEHKVAHPALRRDCKERHIIRSAGSRDRSIAALNHPPQHLIIVLRYLRRKSGWNYARSNFFLNHLP